MKEVTEWQKKPTLECLKKEKPCGAILSEWFDEVWGCKNGLL